MIRLPEGRFPVVGLGSIAPKLFDLAHEGPIRLSRRELASELEANGAWDVQMQEAPTNIFTRKDNRMRISVQSGDSYDGYIVVQPNDRYILSSQLLAECTGECMQVRFYRTWRLEIRSEIVETGGHCGELSPQQFVEYELLKKLCKPEVEVHFLWPVSLFYLFGIHPRDHQGHYYVAYEAEAEKEVREYLQRLQAGRQERISS